MIQVTKDIGLAYHFLNQNKGSRFTAEQLAAGAGIKLAAAQRTGMLLAELRIFHVRQLPHPRRYEMVDPPLTENLPRIHAIEEELRKVILPDLRRAVTQAEAREDLAARGGSYPPHNPMPDRRSTPRRPQDGAAVPGSGSPSPAPNGGGGTGHQDQGASATAESGSPQGDSTLVAGAGYGAGVDDKEPDESARQRADDSPAKVSEGTLLADQRSPGANDASPVFTFSPGEALARAQETDRGFVVLAGSTAKLVTTATFPAGSQILRNQLLDDGSLLQDKSNNLLTFTADVIFTSPSAAASIVAGRSASGPLEWKNGDTGQNYRDWYAFRT